MNFFQLPAYSPEMFNTMKILFITSATMLYLLLPCLLFYFDKRRNLMITTYRICQPHENGNWWDLSDFSDLKGERRFNFKKVDNSFQWFEVFEKNLLFKPKLLSLTFLTFLTICILVVSSAFYFENIQQHILTVYQGNEKEKHDFIMLQEIASYWLAVGCLSFFFTIYVIYEKTAKMIFELNALLAAKPELVNTRLIDAIALHVQSVSWFLPFICGAFIFMHISYFG